MQEAPKTIILSFSLVRDIATYLGTQRIQDALPVFSRLVDETKSQIAAPPAPAETTEK